MAPVIELKMRAGHEAARSLLSIKFLSFDYPGEMELVLLVPSLRREKPLALRLGGAWRYSGDERCLAALGEYGDVRIVHEAGPGG